MLRSSSTIGNWCCLTIKLFEFTAHLEIFVIRPCGRENQLHTGSLSGQTGRLGKSSGIAERSVEWVCVCGGGGGGGRQAGLKNLSSRAAERKIFLAFLGGSGGMLRQKVLKIKYLRLAKSAFPKIFQLIFLVSQKR